MQLAALTSVCIFFPFLIFLPSSVLFYLQFSRKLQFNLRQDLGETDFTTFSFDHSSFHAAQNSSCEMNNNPVSNMHI